MTTARLPTMLGISLRAGWKANAAWVAGLAALMVLTTTSVAGLYGTQAKIDGYARAIGSGNALVLINGHVYGIDTLGGVIANEFGFLASFMVPLLAISLLARATRRDEEAGRLELVLAGRIGRAAPLAAAVVMATAALIVVSVAMAVAMIAVGVPAAGSVIYAASLGTLGFVFVGVAGLAAQLVLHSRGVYAAGLAVLVVGYLLRGIGDVTGTWLTWLSPLGWAEETRAFGDARPWPLVTSIVAGAALSAAALAIARTRDLGSAVVSHGAAPPAASAFLRSAVGLAVATHRGVLIGWAAGAVVVGGLYGSLTENIVEAMADNDTLREVFSGADGTDGALSMAVLLVAVVCCGYVVHGVGLMRAEESAGRLEELLTDGAGRVRWFTVQLATVAAGLIVVAALGTATLDAGFTLSTGGSRHAGIIGAVASYLPAAAVLLGVAAVIYGRWPRLFVLGWLAYAFTVLVPLLGDALQLPGWLRDISPMNHVGLPPQNPVAAAALVILLAVAALLLAGAIAGFRRRDVPQVSAA